MGLTENLGGSIIASRIGIRVFTADSRKPATIRLLSPGNTPKLGLCYHAIPNTIIGSYVLFFRWINGELYHHITNRPEKSPTFKQG